MFLKKHVCMYFQNMGAYIAETCLHVSPKHGSMFSKTWWHVLPKHVCMYCRNMGACILKTWRHVLYSDGGLPFRPQKEARCYSMPEMPPIRSAWQGKNRAVFIGCRWGRGGKQAVGTGSFFIEVSTITARSKQSQNIILYR